MATGKQFNASLDKWAQAAKGKMDALARQTSQEVSERVVRATPVDTGFLRSSWQPSLGAPKESAGAEGAQARPLGEIGLTCAGMKAGDVYYMTNGAKYARHVEYGTSRMAGRFYTTDVVSQWSRIVDKVARDLGIRK